MLLLQTTFLVGLTVDDEVIVLAKLAETAFLSNESLSKNLTLRCLCSCRDSWSFCWIKGFVVVVLIVGAVVEVADVVDVKEWSSGV